MIPDILDLPWWVKLIIILATAFAGFIAFAVIIRNKKAQKEKAKRIEKQIQKIKDDIANAKQKFEKLLRDYPNYYFIPEKIRELREISNQIQNCPESNVAEFNRLAKLYTEVFYTSFKVLSKYDLELMRALNEYIDSVYALVVSNHVSKIEKHAYVPQLTPYLHALDIKPPDVFRRYIPSVSYLGKGASDYKNMDLPVY